MRGQFPGAREDKLSPFSKTGGRGARCSAVAGPSWEEKLIKAASVLPRDGGQDETGLKTTAAIPAKILEKRPSDDVG